MFGALISVLMFVLFGSWAALVSKLKKFKKGKCVMSIFEFVLFCILTYIVITPLLIIVCTLLDDACLHHIILNNDVNIAIAILICLLIVTSFVILETKRFIGITQVKSKNNQIKSRGSFKSDDIISSLVENDQKRKSHQDQEVAPPNKREILSPTTFIKTYTLIDFAMQYGPKMKVGTFRNNKTREEYKTCMFINSNGLRTFVNFSTELGELTPLQISERKNELMIGQLPTGKFILYDNNWKDWADVNLNV